MYIITNKKNGASWRITDEAKEAWQSGPYGKLFEFVKVQEPPKATKPEHVKPAAKKMHTKKQSAKRADNG